MQALLDPVVLFFLLGALAGVVKSGLRIPKSVYNTLSIYLLLSIGIKGGIELFDNSLENIAFPALGTIILGAVITFVAFIVLLKKFDKPNAIAIATHYGSVSAVTFAVVLSYLDDRQVHYDEYVTVLLVLLEIPAIAVGIFMAKWNFRSKSFNIKAVLHEIFLGKTIILLIGGLIIGLVTANTGNKQLHSFFFDLFKGFLAIFMLEMGILASQRFSDLKKAGIFLFFFGIVMPIISAVLGIAVGMLTGLSVGGTVVLATMAASASYIAAPAAMKIAIPEANATFYLSASLGITFPFNVVFGIPLYYHLSIWLFDVFGLT